MLRPWSPRKSNPPVVHRDTALEQEQKALGRCFSDFEENINDCFDSINDCFDSIIQGFDDLQAHMDRRFIMLTWAVGLLAATNLAMLGWLIARGGG